MATNNLADVLESAKDAAESLYGAAIALQAFEAGPTEAARLRDEFRNLGDQVTTMTNRVEALQRQEARAR